MRIEINEVNRLLSRNKKIMEEIKITFNNLSTELTDICNLIQSSGLSTANEKFKTYFEDVGVRLQTNLETVSTFLQRQINAYDAVYDINISPEMAKAELEKLSADTGNLKNNSNSIEYIFNTIKNNWEVTDESNTDIASSLIEINKCLVDMNDIITPVLEEYKNTLETLILAHQATGEKTVEITGKASNSLPVSGGNTPT